jgi:hypothetical protein
VYNLLPTYLDRKAVSYPLATATNLLNITTASNKTFFKQMVLERYFEMSSFGVKLVLPTQPDLCQKLRAPVQSQMDVLWKDEDNSGRNYIGLFQVL